MGAYLVAGWNHCSLDNKSQPASGWGIYIAILAMMYYFSTLRAPARHPHLSAISGMIGQLVHEHPLQSLSVFLIGTLTAAVPFLLLFRALQGAFVPLALGWMVMFLIEGVLALRWLRHDVRRTHEQGFSGFLWPLHVPAIYWVWAWGFGPTVVIGLVVLVNGWGR
jgi:hypothetical protein